MRKKLMMLAGVAAIAWGLATAAMAAPPIEAYGALPAIASMSISPSGKLLAVVLNKGKQHVVAFRRLDGDRKVFRSVQVNDRFGGVTWADDDHVFLSSHRTLNVGTEFQTEYGMLFLVNLKNGTEKQVDVDNSNLSLLPPQLIQHKDGHAYGYFQARFFDEERKGEGILFREDLDSEQIIEVAHSGKNQGAFLLNPDAEIKARMQYLDHGRKWSVLRGKSDDFVLAQGQAEVGVGRMLGFGQTPDTVLVGIDENGTLADIHEVNIATGQVGKRLVEDGLDVQPIHDRNTELLIGIIISGYDDDLVFLDKDLDSKWLSVKSAFPGNRVTLSSTSYDRTRWVVEVEGPHNSGTYYLVDLASHQAISLGERYPDIKPQDVGAFQWFDYKAQDGTALKAMVTLPPGYTMETARNLPGVVLPHGGPQGRDYDRFDWWAQAVASRGYVVIQPEFRGSGGFGQAFERAGWGQWGKIMQTDVSDAFKAVAAKGIVDPGRTCVHGWSYGGYATMASVTVQQGLYRCAIAGAGVYDLNAMLVWTGAGTIEGSLDPTNRYWKTSMGLNGTNDPAGDAISPAKLASRISVPVMLIHGREDTTVPIEQSNRMADAMRAANKPFEYVVLEKETHHLEEAETRTKMLQAAIGFLLKNNPPGPVAPPAPSAKTR